MNAKAWIFVSLALTFLSLLMYIGVLICILILAPHISPMWYIREEVLAFTFACTATFVCALLLVVKGFLIVKKNARKALIGQITISDIALAIIGTTFGVFLAISAANDLSSYKTCLILAAIFCLVGAAANFVDNCLFLALEFFCQEACSDIALNSSQDNVIETVTVDTTSRRQQSRVAIIPTSNNTSSELQEVRI